MIALSAQQTSAADAVMAWWRANRNTPGVFRLYGFAGTGKTTTTDTIATRVYNEGGNVVQLTLTGKAAKVLSEKSGRPAVTIHSLLYSFAGLDENNEPIFKTLDHKAISLINSLKVNGLIVLDECSMIPRHVMADLLALRVPVLALGDPFQLPPVKASAYFDNRCDAMLTEVHRQAADNPILRASMLIRDNRIGE
ncbi:MAG TPA: AAA family ATPase, partial [Alphaproteobacteria bacterium]|nr:AAA family ATPase [Alphaproteobacteria bacterium]